MVTEKLMWEFFYKTLLILKSTFNPFFRLEGTNQQGHTLLMQACFDNNLPLVKALLKAGANPNPLVQFDKSPLAFAIQNSLSEIAVTLIQAGANTENKNSLGATPLILASTNGDIAVVRALIHAKTNVNALDNIKNSALCWAITYRHTHVATELINANTNVNSTNMMHDTPLNYAVCTDNETIVNKLIQAGAIVNQVGLTGRTPLHAAVSKNNFVIGLKLLHAMKADAIKEVAKDPAFREIMKVFYKEQPRSGYYPSRQARKWKSQINAATTCRISRRRAKISSP